MKEETRKISAKDLLFSDDATARKVPPICPQCGTWNPPEAKFCKKDGVKLPERGGRGEVQPDRSPVATTGQGAGEVGISGERPLPQSPKKYLYLFIIVGILLVVVAAGSYRYYPAERGATIQAVQRTPEGKAEEKGAVRRENDVPVSPPREPERPAEAAQPPTAAPVSSQPEAQPRGETRKKAGKKPADKHVQAVSAKPKKEAKEAKQSEERPDPAKTEGRLNKLLRSSGIVGVTAEVGGNMSVTLKGTVSSGRDKARALSLAKGLREVKGVRDIIFVIEP